MLCYYRRILDSAMRSVKLKSNLFRFYYLFRKDNYFNEVEFIKGEGLFDVKTLNDIDNSSEQKH